MRAVLSLVVAGLACVGAACRAGSDQVPRASGYVEATEVRVAAEVGGRILELAAEEGRRVAAGDILARLETSSLEIALRRAEAQRDQAAAQLRLVRAGARREYIRQAQAQVASIRAEVAGAEAELEAASEDLRRFAALLAANAGSRKQRDDAAARVSTATAKVRATRERAQAAEQAVTRLRSGARPEEIAAADAQVAAASAQVAALEEDIANATVKAPVDGTVTSTLVDVGELVAPRAPIAVISDLDRAWANIYVDEPLVPHLTVGQAATLLTDGGHRLPGTITYISPRAEFTPRNVQTADERSTLVYRIKVTVDNRGGVLKPGMPVEAEMERPRPERGAGG